MTKRDFYGMVIDGVVNDDMVDFAKAEIKKLNASNAKRSTKTAEKQMVVIEQIESMDYDAQTAAEIRDIVNATYGTDYTLPKISSMLKKCVETRQTLSKVIEKGKGYYTTVA